MPAYDKNDLQRRMHGARRSAEARPRRPAHRPRLDRAARSDHRSRSMAPTCRSTRSRRSRCPSRGLLSVQVWDRGNVSPVEKAIRIGRARPQPDHRRPDDPPADPRSDRGAAQGTRQARRPICRKGAHRRPQRPPRRHGRISRPTRRSTRSARTSASGSRAEVQKLTDDDDRRDRRRRARQGKGNPRQVTSNPAATRGGDACTAVREASAPAMSRSSWTATAAGPSKRGLPRVAGHRAGAEAVRRTLKCAVEARRRSPYALCFFLGELAPVGGGGRRPHGAAWLLPRARAGRACAKKASGSG